MSRGTYIFARRVAVFIALFMVMLTLVLPRISMTEESRSGSDDSERTKKSDLGGYYKSFLTVYQYPVFKGLDISGKNALEGTAQNTLRLEYNWTPFDNVSMNAAWALNPTVTSNSSGDFAETLLRPDPFQYRVCDIPDNIYPEDSGSSSNFKLANNLDRFFVTMKTRAADIMIGRQPVAFGSAKTINPTDVLAPFLFSELDKEERVGVDALRIRIPMGDMQEIDSGYVMGDSFKISQSAFFARVRLYILNTDITPTLIAFRNNFLVGLDLTRSLGQAGYWFEAGFVFADLFGDYKGRNNYLRLSTGVDYTLADGLYGFIEYHYNGAGKLHPYQYKELIATPAYGGGSDYLLGQHYLSPGINWEISPLVNLSSALLFNMNDPSLLLSITIQYNIAQNIFIDLGTYLSLGRKSSIDSVSSPDLALDSLTTKSEFGLYPKTYFAATKFYF